VAGTGDLRSLTEIELRQKLQEARQELFNLRFRLSTKQLDDTSRLRTVRRQIARLETVLSERAGQVGQEG
jgi:large subunit ribosomal protein L29